MSEELKAPRLRAAKAWIFDMDGTLTMAAHDFDAIRAQLDLPAGMPILESLAMLREPLRSQTSRRLDALELEIAAASRPAPGAAQLLDALRARGCRLGVLTRNSRRNALVTLDAAGLGARFDDEEVLGRDDAAPKPSPAGIERLLARWELEAAHGVMVGDFRFDLEAGRAAGVLTVHADASGAFEFEALADFGVRRLDELLTVLGESGTRAN